MNEEQSLWEENEDWDAREEESATYELLPAGVYELIATAAEFKPFESAKGHGENLNITFEVIGEQYAGRKIFERFCWKHSDGEKAVKIARQRFGDLCKATGMFRPKVPSDLFNLPFTAKVGVEKGTGGYQDRNNVKDYVYNKEEVSSPATAARTKAASKVKKESPFG